MEKQLLKDVNNKTLNQLHILLQTFFQPFIIITMVFVFLKWLILENNMIHFHSYMLLNLRSIYTIIVKKKR